MRKAVLKVDVSEELDKWADTYISDYSHCQSLGVLYGLAEAIADSRPLQIKKGDEVVLKGYMAEPNNLHVVKAVDEDLAWVRSVYNPYSLGKVVRLKDLFLAKDDDC